MFGRSGMTIALAALFAVIAFCCFAVVDVSDESEAVGETHGTCGSNLEWDYDPDTGALTITGTGAMTNYYSYNTRWGGNTIRSVSLPNGLTSIGDYAFYECKSLSSISIPDSTTLLGERCFGQCLSLTEVSVGKGVNSLDGYTFYLCEKLESISVSGDNATYTSIDGVIFSKDGTELVYCPINKTRTTYTCPDGTTSIGKDAFMNSLLTDIVIPNGVTSIGNAAFSHSKVRSITLPDSLVSMGNEAFGYCFDLTSISLGKGLTSIPNKAFSECVSLASIIIPEGVTEIGNYAFSSCRSLESVIMPDSVTSLGSNTFANCTALASVSLSKGLTILKRETFSDCSALRSIVIPEGITAIKDYAFSNCKSMESIELPESLTAMDNPFPLCCSLKSIKVSDVNTAFCSVDGVLFSKDMTVLIQYPAGRTDAAYTIPDSVTGISGYAFSGSANLISVSIPDGVKYIGWAAFSQCTSLREIVFPSELTTIGGNAFSYCISLTSITVPNGVTEIGDEAFMSCSSLRMIELPEGLTSMEEGIFIFCTSLESIAIPDSVTSFGGTESMFYGCTSLRSIYLGNCRADTNDFNKCTALESITVSPSSTEMKTEDGVLFNSSNNLILYPAKRPGATYIVPDFTYQIVGKAFQDCSLLQTLILPADFGGFLSSFIHCPSLRSVEVASESTSLLTVDGVMFNKDKSSLIHYPNSKTDESYVIPSGVIYISEEAFRDCVNLKSIIIPDTVTTIGDYAFCGCISLESISLPEGLEVISTSVFENCESLKSITIPKSVRDIEYRAFYGCKSMEAFVVAEGNNCYCSADGVLYELGMSVLVQYPAARAGTSYTLPANLRSISTFSLTFTNNLKELCIDSSNTHYSTSGGCLFTNGGKYLIACPGGLESYMISKDVRWINGCAFTSDNLKSVTFAGDCIAFVSAGFITDCPAFEKIVVEDGAVLNLEGWNIFYNDDNLHTIHVVAPSDKTIQQRINTWGNVELIYDGKSSDMPDPAGDPDKEFPVLFVAIGGIVAVLALGGIAFFLKRRGA